MIVPLLAFEEAIGAHVPQHPLDGLLVGMAFLKCGVCNGLSATPSLVLGLRYHDRTESLASVRMSPQSVSLR